MFLRISIIFLNDLVPACTGIPAGLFITMKLSLFSIIKFPLIFFSFSDGLYFLISDLFSKLQDKNSVKKVFETLSKRYASRKGGYSRVLKAGFRTGDDAPMAIIELVDRDINAKKIDKPKKIDPTKKDKEPLKKATAK